MNVLAFLLGLTIGLLLLGWQRSRFNARLQRLLNELRSYADESSLSSVSRLTLAVTRQQAVQQELKHQNDEYRQILNGAPVGYLQVDDENRLVWCNAQACRMLAISPDAAATPRLLLELVRSYELDALIEQTRDRQQLCQKDWTFYPISPDPSQLSQQQSSALRGIGFPLTVEQVGIFLENRQEVLTLTQQRDRWASDVAHELKTPLTSIRLVAETLHPRLEPGLRGWVERLINETIRLSNLVQDLLDMALLDRESTQSLRLKRTNLTELIHSAWMNVEPLARKKQLQLNYQGPDSLCLALDEARIYRVLINLLDNAIKYSPPWQSIQVSLSTGAESSWDKSPQICLEVIDAGPGFEEEALPHVFERFFRADPARARNVDLGAIATVPLNDMTTSRYSSQDSKSAPVEPKNAQPQDTQPQDKADRTPATPQRSSSSGLGLAIVQQIVEAHGGSVSVANHPETGGGWLRVWLPVQTEHKPWSGEH